MPFEKSQGISGDRPLASFMRAWRSHSLLQRAILAQKNRRNLESRASIYRLGRAARERHAHQQTFATTIKSAALGPMLSTLEIF
jgi:hypothetical protein